MHVCVFVLVSFIDDLGVHEPLKVSVAKAVCVAGLLYCYIEHRLCSNISLQNIH